MATTSKERRNVAELMRDEAAGFRKLSEEYDGAWTVDLGDVPAIFQDITHYVGLDGVVRADAIFDRLADLIDPTCKRVSMDAAGNPPFYTGGLALNDETGGCSKCGYPFGNSNARIGNPFNMPNYCPNCGARCVDDGGKS